MSHHHVTTPPDGRPDSEQPAWRKDFPIDAEQDKPIGAICHGPWLLVEADLLRDRTATSWPSIRTDLRNAGAMVVDEPAVTDGKIVTSRNPDDVEAFTDALIALLADQAATREIREPTEVPA